MNKSENPTTISELYENTAATDQITSEGNGSYSKTEDIIFTNGIEIVVEGATFPKKGFPTPTAVFASNQVKRIIMESIRIFSDPVLILSIGVFTLLPRRYKRKFLNKMLDSFSQIAWKAMSPFILKERYMMNFCKETANLICQVLGNLGISTDTSIMIAKIIAHIFEYDNAYRYRIEDIFTESSQDKWRNPRNEIKRLLKVYKQREKNPHVIRKVNNLSKILSIVLLSSWVNNAIKNAFADIDIRSLQLDEADWFWSAQRDDYEFFGHTKEENMAELVKRGYTEATYFTNESVV